jgi:hypothetical protein
MISNIDLFNGVAGKIFAILYQSFPVKTEIDFDSLMIDFIDPDDYDGVWELSDFAKSTANWLDESGYIWLESPQHYGGKHAAVLSPKGLEVLQATPKTIDPKKSLGEKIIEFSKGKFNESLSEVVKVAISEGVKLFF